MKNRGYTLLELILVMVIIAVLIGIAAQSVIKTDEGQRSDRTMAEMEMLVGAIVGDERLISGGVRTDFGYVGDVGSLPPNLDALVGNPGGYSTWNGPYVHNKFIEDPDDYKKDAWNDPYGYAGGLTITSTGGGNSLTRQIANSVAELTSNSIYGVVQDRSGCPPADSAANVLVTVTYPDGAGSMTSLSTVPERSGEFAFVNSIPIGLQLIRAVVSGVDDTTSRYVAINPGSRTFAELKFPSDLWSGTGGVGGQIEYVNNSAYTSPAGDLIRFQIINTNASSVTISAMTLEYISSPDAYYRRIRWNSSWVWDNSNPRNGSGDAATFSASQTLASMESALIEVNTWKTCPTGNCANYDIHGTAFTVTFSNGDVITFSVP